MSPRAMEGRYLPRWFWLLLGIIAVAPAFAQQWPERPVRIVVPFPAGGNTDAIARITADYLATSFGKPFVVENRPGAGGAIAAEFVAKATPDGYTLFLAALPQMAIVPAMSKVRYDPLNDFVPVSIVGRNVFLLALHPAVPVQNLAQLVSHVRAQPGQLAYASGGTGSVSHLSVVLLLNRAKLEMIHVPFGGGPQAVAAVVGGQATLYFGNLTEVTPLARAGKLRLIAVSDDKRIPDLPDVPTVAEQGYPDFRTETWNGVVVPAGTSAAIVQRLANAIAEATRDENVVRKLKSIGVEPVTIAPADFAQRLRSDIAMWRDAVRISGARAD